MTADDDRFREARELDDLAEHRAEQEHRKIELHEDDHLVHEQAGEDRRHSRGIGEQHRAQGRDRREQNDAEAAIGDEHQKEQRSQNNQEVHSSAPTFRLSLNFEFLLVLCLPHERAAKRSRCGDLRFSLVSRLRPDWPPAFSLKVICPKAISMDRRETAVRRATLQGAARRRAGAAPSHVGHEVCLLSDAKTHAIRNAPTAVPAG